MEEHQLAAMSKSLRPAVWPEAQPSVAAGTEVQPPVSAGPEVQSLPHVGRRNGSSRRMRKRAWAERNTFIQPTDATTAAAEATADPTDSISQLEELIKRKDVELAGVKRLNRQLTTFRSTALACGSEVAPHLTTVVTSYSEKAAKWDESGNAMNAFLVRLMCNCTDDQTKTEAADLIDQCSTAFASAHRQLISKQQIQARDKRMRRIEQLHPSDVSIQRNTAAKATQTDADTTAKSLASQTFTRRPSAAAAAQSQTSHTFTRRPPVAAAAQSQASLTFTRRPAVTDTQTQARLTPLLLFPPSSSPPPPPVTTSQFNEMEAVLDDMLTHIDLHFDHRAVRSESHYKPLP